MNKRRSCVLDVLKPSKTPRTEGKTCVQDEMDVDEEDGVQDDQPLSASVSLIIKLFIYLCNTRLIGKKWGKT